MTVADEIAAAAARLVVEDGMEYGPAKRRAARDLGRHGGRRGELPSNEAVEDEVREYLSIFCADTQPAELRALRELALVWLERLAEFRPHVAGAVWRGTATRLSALHVELYCDDPKSAEISLVNAGVSYDVGCLERHGKDAVSVLTLADRVTRWPDPVTLHLEVFDLDDLRGALKPDAKGRSWRGDLAALRRRLAEEAG
jgi:hypothetical protein